VARVQEVSREEALQGERQTDVEDKHGREVSMHPKLTITAILALTLAGPHQSDGSGFGR
jgi:hypothetical protein